jgi:hypothetical protein
MAFPGMFITKRVVVSLENELKVSYGVFRINFFSRNYFQEPIDSVDAHWTRLANEEMKPEPVKEGAPSPVVMNIHVANPGEVGKALEAARAKLVQQDNPPVVVNVISHEGDVSEEVKAEADRVEMNTEILQFEQDMATGRELTPVEQRQLITEDTVEAEAEVDLETSDELKLTRALYKSVPDPEVK